MAISGSLKDVSVADVMQFIHLGRRTGTLLLPAARERAMIGFHGGRLVTAQAPQTPKLGDLLISSGMIDRGILDRAIRVQNEEPERRSLGQILISSGSIDAEGLRQVIAQQIEQAVSEVMVWDTGTFEFAIDDLRPIDDIALYPSDVLPDADINTQMVLLEAARIFDERNRDEPAERAAEAPAAAAAGGYEAGDSTHPSLLEPDRRRAGWPWHAGSGSRAGSSRRADPKHRRRAAATCTSSRADGAVRRAARGGPAARGGGGGAGASEPGRPAWSPGAAAADRAARPAGRAASPWSRPPRSGVAVPGRRSSRWSTRAPLSLGSTRRACWPPCRPRSRRWSACVENVIESRRDLVRGAPRPEHRAPASPGCGGSSATCARG